MTVVLLTAIFTVQLPYGFNSVKLLAMTSASAQFGPVGYKRGFVLLPRRWVVERSFAWAARFRRLARDYERLATTLAGYHWLAFVMLMLTWVFGKS
jgi:Transposase DDE domain